VHLPHRQREPLNVTTCLLNNTKTLTHGCGLTHTRLCTCKTRTQHHQPVSSHERRRATERVRLWYSYVNACDGGCRDEVHSLSATVTPQPCSSKVTRYLHQLLSLRVRLRDSRALCVYIIFREVIYPFYFNNTRRL
jgi:hypothetical protein